MGFGFGERLAKLRKLKKLRQVDLGAGMAADGTDSNKSVVSGWEKEQHYPKVDQLRALCDRLGCSADFLLFGIRPAFSHAMRTRVTLLDELEVVRLENVMRSHLGMAQLSDDEKLAMTPVTSAEPYTDEMIPVKTDSPDQKRSVILGGKAGEADLASSQSSGVRKQRRN